MDLISKRWRKPKGRPSKRRKANLENSHKRFKKTECTSDVSEVQELASQPESDFIIAHKTVFDELLEKVPCKSCESCSLTVKQTRSMGYSIKLELLCETCGLNYGSAFSSPKDDERHSHVINSKLVSAFLSIGRGHAALETFSSILNMPTMDKRTFAKCMLNLSVKNKNIKQRMLQVSREAAREAHIQIDSSLSNKEIIDINVSYDGTWQKRGHTSNLGLGIIIDIVSGLVLDFEILSKYCHSCVMTAKDLGVDTPEFHIWLEGHSTECEKNFEESSGAMEMHAALIMWQRSIEDCKMRYTSVLSDGDARTLLFLNENKVYGPDLEVQKEECLNHVAKRLGTSLRNKIKEWRAKKVTLGGKKKGSLTEKNIVKLQNFYRKAIKDNVPDVNKMKTAIYATLMHCSSTNDKPQHSKCPDGEISWCFYNRALSKGEMPQCHSTMKTILSPQVVEKIMPVYQRLASNSILERCAAGKTQNANESLHSCIWRKCPKEVFVSKRRLELAVTDTVEKHNLGYVKSLETDDQLLKSSFSLTIAKRKDHRRAIQKSSVDKKTKPKRNSIKKDNLSYCAGGF